MNQPIPKHIKESRPELATRKVTTLLVDGSNLLEVCYTADKKVSSEGRSIGGIFQFMLQLKLLLRKGNFDHVYCFFDGPNSGQLRYNENREYKANREDKTFKDDGISDYMKEFNASVKSMTKYFTEKKQSKPRRTESEKENFMWQKEVIMDVLENLFVYTIECEETEADDFIGYYCKHKPKNERVVICSNDRDLTQLIDDDVIVYVQSLHDFVNKRNHTEKMGYNYQNVVLKKILCGDTSDNIKGIKGLGDTTLLREYPEFKVRKVTLDEVIDKARAINEQRAKDKKKPLQWASNIVNRVTNGCQGEHIYEINKKIIDLSEPLMTDEAVELIESMMGAPMDPEGREMSNVYRMLCDAGVDDLRDENTFSRFFVEFEYLIDKEKKFFNSNASKNVD